MMLFLLLVAFSGHAQEFEWSSVRMDGSRTGCVAVTSSDVEKSIGSLNDDGNYLAPNGRVYNHGTATASVAAIVHAAQPELAKVKTVIAYSEDEMITAKRETPLSNWFVDIVMKKVSALSGKKVDVGICNFGGIRVNMPKGNVMLDDMLSMFPFKNYVVYLEHKGSELRKIFEKMAATRFEALGGVEIVAENGKLTKSLIGGQPIDDERLYSVATISYLLYGGDSLTLAENAENMTIYDIPIIDIVLEYIAALNADGKNITAPSVTHVTIK